MEAIIRILQSIAAPLSSELVLAAIAAGLFFGAIYNYHLEIPKALIFHKLVTGLGFIVFMAIFRIASDVMTGEVTTNPLGWIGIGLLWILFVSFIWIGSKINEPSLERTRSKE